LAVFIAATVPVEKEGAVNPLLEAAKSLGDAEDERREDEPQRQQQPAENGNGSFERFMATFGSPARWAGH
jgi:hypothetical protein